MRKQKCITQKNHDDYTDKLFLKKKSKKRIRRRIKYKEKIKRELYNNKKKNHKKYNLTLKLLLLIFLLFIYRLIPDKKLEKKRIGIISLFNDQNPGNVMVKFAIYTKLKEFGLDPIIVCGNNRNTNIDYVNRTVKLKVIKSFSELNESDYDILMVNSDQTWAAIESQILYDMALLKFAENWNIPKFIYAASMGQDYWNHKKKFEEMGKKILKNFTGISFREKKIVELAKEHLNISSVFVLDPTFLIDKHYYLDTINNYKRDINFNEKYLFIHQLDKNNLIENAINKATEKLNYKLYKLKIKDIDFVENFLFGINMSQAVITDSYHGTVFSIIFNKPFISFINRGRGSGRFNSLREALNLRERIMSPTPNCSDEIISLLLKPPNVNQTLFNELKKFSLDFLKQNLGVK